MPDEPLRVAQCRCGQARAECRGEPVRVSVCHCLACKRRTGSAFSAQARFPAERVRLSGETRSWTRTAESGARMTYRFCGECGANIAYWLESGPEVIAVPMGAFADPDFPAPRFSVWEEYQHRWVALLGDDIEHRD